MSKLAFLLLKTVESAATGTVNTTEKLFTSTFNVTLTGSVDEAPAPQAEVLGAAKVGTILLAGVEAIEAAFFAGEAKLAFAVPVAAPTDTTPGQFYNLVGTVTRA